MKTTRTIQEWQTLTQRYFEATTTPREENELRKFLTSEASDAPCFNEIKAVMGYLAVGKEVRMRTTCKSRRYDISRIAGYSAAAVITVACILGIWHANLQEENIYIAYIDGKRYTDKATVLSQMQKAITHVNNNTEQYSAHEQLSDIFGTLNENNKEIEIRTE